MKQKQSLLVCVLILLALTGCGPKHQDPQYIAYVAIDSAAKTYNAAVQLLEAWKASETAAGTWTAEDTTFWNEKVVPTEVKIHDSLVIAKGALKIYVGTPNDQTKANLDKLMADLWALIYDLQKIATNHNNGE